MAITDNSSYVVVDQDPNLEGDLQGGQNQMLAVLDTGGKVWKFVTGNAPGAKWEEI